MLTSLDVGFNNLDEEAALSIVRAVRPGDQMASLGLAKCSIGPTGLQRSPSTSRTARRRGGCADVDETDAMGGAWLCVGRGIQSRHPNRRQTTKSSQVGLATKAGRRAALEKSIRLLARGPLGLCGQLLRIERAVDDERDENDSVVATLGVTRVRPSADGDPRSVPHACDLHARRQAAARRMDATGG